MLRRRFMGNTKVIGPINTNNYLTIEALQDGLTAKLSTNSCEYCVDGDGNWQTLPADTYTVSINKGQTLNFRGNIEPVASVGIGTFHITQYCNLSGNVMSMIYGDRVSHRTLNKEYAFYRLFYNCYKIQNVAPNFLPATTVSAYCYYEMFYNCTWLITAPELPATDLAEYCYYSMFRNCELLEEAPALPATDLYRYCYCAMFYDCKSLTKMPDLPAMFMAERCYSSMFRGCTLLDGAAVLRVYTVANYCFYRMFYDCRTLRSMYLYFTGELKKHCCSYMCYNCARLGYMALGSSTTPSASYTENWVYGVDSDGEFYKDVDAAWDERGVHGIPDGWSIINENWEI